MNTRPILILMLPELGGLGKSTIAEQLVAVLEAAGRSVIAMDGDPSSRGLMARRRGRRTVAIQWPDEPVSRAGAIRAAVSKAGVGILDFGAGSSQTLSVDPTVSELCDGTGEVETVIAAIGEASKPGNAAAIRRLRGAYRVKMMFVRNAKSGHEWSSFTEVADRMPVLNIPRASPAITSWLSNHDCTVDDAGEVARPALVDLVLHPQPGFNRISSVLRSMLNEVSQQDVMQRLFKLDALPGARALGQAIDLPSGPMTDSYLEAHDRACNAGSKLLRAVPPTEDEDRQAWVRRMGEVALSLAGARQEMNVQRDMHEDQFHGSFTQRPR